MLKYNSILRKIKLFYFILTGKIKKNNKLIKISNKNRRNIKNILIIFPINSDDFRVALYTFRGLLKDKNINYYFLINSIFKQHFHLRGYVFEVFHNVRNNKLKINETFYEDRILNKEYDFIIDLNKEYLFDIAILINDLDGFYKIGISNKHSDYFYNIQFSLNDNGVLEEIYNKILSIIN